MKLSRSPRSPALLPAVIVAALLPFAAGCARTAERAADRFVDLYFIEIDQAAALDYTIGLAHQKLEDELTLTRDVRRTTDPNAARPTVFRQRRSFTNDGERARASYDITIKFGGDETRKRALLTLDHSRGEWRVGNFTVQEGGRF